MSEVIHGACLCGQVAFEVHEPETIGSCHCTRCQRWTGAQGVTVVVATAASFKITKGQELLKRYEEAPFATRCFCGNCGSNLYGDGGEKYYVGAGVLQDVKLKPAFHIQVAYKAPWYEIGGDAPQFPEWPPA